MLSRWLSKKWNTEWTCLTGAFYGIPLHSFAISCNWNFDIWWSHLMHRCIALLCRMVSSCYDKCIDKRWASVLVTVFFLDLYVEKTLMESIKQRNTGISYRLSLPLFSLLSCWHVDLWASLLSRRYKDGDLSVGENTCIDRCSSKYWQVLVESLDVMCLSSFVLAQPIIWMTLASFRLLE